MTAPIRDLATARRELGALPVPLGRRDIAALDVRLADVESELRAAPTQTDTTPEEGQP